jgi:LysM repeat protein
MKLTTRLRYSLLGLLAIVLLITGTPQPAHAEDHVSAAVHTVTWGETVGTIAENYGVSAEAIIAANNLSQPDMLYAGAQLVIPGAAPAPGPALQN